MEGILAVESHLFLVVIRSGLLFLYLLFHVGEHLKVLVFMSLRWLGIGGYLLRRGGAKVLSCMQLIVDWRRDHTPSGADDLAFGCHSVDGEGALSWGHADVEEAC